MATVNTRTFVLPLADRLRALGCEVHIATGPGDYVEHYRDLGYPTTVVPITRRLLAWENVTAIRQLHALMRREQYDIVHTHTLFSSYLVRIAAGLAGVPQVIYQPRGSYFGYTPTAERSFILAEKLFKRVNTRIVTLTAQDARDFAAYGIAPPERIVNLGCGGSGIDFEMFNPDRIPSEELERLRREFGIRPGERVISFIGRMVSIKGIDELLEAFRKVAARHPEARLLMIGGVLESERDKSAFPRFKQRARAYGLEDRIIYTGFRKDTPELLALTDLYVHSSRMEPFGMTLAESAAMGKPVVTTATRGGLEAVRQGETGLIVPLHNAEALAEAINSLLDDPARMQEMGRNAYRHAREAFTRDRVLGLQMATYADLIAEIRSTSSSIPAV